MTEQDLEIQKLRQQNAELKKTLKAALKDLDYCLVQFEMCQICAYADADCDPDAGQCKPKWRGLV
jgi:hypothetical protein